MAKNLIGFQKGSTFELNADVTYTEDQPGLGVSAGDPVDITGWTITAQAFPPRSNNTTRRIITFDVTITDAANGLYTIDNPDVATSDWLSNTKYNLKITQMKSNGFVYSTPTVVIDCRDFL